MEPADQLALDVRLEVDDVDAGLDGVSAQISEDVGERFVAVDLRFPRAEQVEVRSVEDEDGSSHGESANVVVVVPT